MDDQEKRCFALILCQTAARIFYLSLQENGKMVATLTCYQNQAVTHGWMSVSAKSAMDLYFIAETNIEKEAPYHLEFILSVTC